MRSLFIAAALVVAAGGCKKKAPPPVPVAEAPAPPPPVAPEVTGSPEAEDPLIVEMRQNFERVFFAFDSAALTPDAIAELQKNAKILMEHPDLRVTIQGHADERGTTDYNLALADERAAKVRDTLVGMGVKPSALTVVSFGEERPLDGRSGEIAWSKNRRAEFAVTRDPSGNVEGTLQAPPPTVDDVVMEDENKTMFEDDIEVELAPPSLP